MTSINDLVAEELAVFPRGPRGSAQNLFRSAYQMARTHSLAAESSDRWSKEECVVVARDAVRATTPEFEPLLRLARIGAANG